MMSVLRRLSRGFGLLSYDRDEGTGYSRLVRRLYVLFNGQEECEGSIHNGLVS